MRDAAADEALAFGERLIALLDGGRFTATYKYAVLLALVDECRAGVDAAGRAPRVLSGKRVGRRVFELYWPQARPLGAHRVRRARDPTMSSPRSRLESASSHCPQVCPWLRRGADVPRRSTRSSATWSRR